MWSAITAASSGPVTVPASPTGSTAATAAPVASIAAIPPAYHVSMRVRRRPADSVAMSARIPA